VAAVASVLVSMPSSLVSQAVVDACDDLLFTVSNNIMYDVRASTMVATNPRQSCDSGPGFATFSVDLAPDGSHYGYITGACNGGGLPKWGRINPAANNANLGDGLSPFYVPLHDLPPTYNWPLNPAFLPTLPTAGGPFGYRFNTEDPLRFVNGLNHLQLYGIDSIAPYREHLVFENAFAPQTNKFANFGLGTVAAKDGSKLWYVTIDGIYELDLTLGPPAYQIMFLAVYHISENATIAGSSSEGFRIVDGSVMYQIDIPTQLVQVAQFPPEIGRAVDASRYPCVAGGMRIEPHAELVTTEAGGTASFTAVLTAPPAQDVTVNFASTDTTEGTVSPASATFTNGNWSTPQTITVTGVADIDTSDQAYRITTSNLSSADPNFNGRIVLDVDVSNTHINQLPSLTSGSATAVQGSPTATRTLGTVSDLETAAGSLGIATITAPPGLTVGTVTNIDGTLTAPMAASCTATTGARALTLRITDGTGATTDQDATITVLSNPAPTLGSYAATPIFSGAATPVTSSAAPADNVAVSSVEVSSPTFTGTLSVDASTGTVSVSNAGPVGVHTVTITATDNCGVTSSSAFVLTVTCPPLSLAAPGAAFTIGGGSGSVAVTAGPGCAWTSSNSVSWIDLLIGNGTGAGTATFTVADNRSGSPRTTNLTIGGQPFTVTQSFGYADAVIVAGVTPIRALHLLEPRILIDRLRSRLELPAYVWTDANATSGVTPIRAVHVIELRTALLQAYAATDETEPTFTDDLLGNARVVRAVHLNELRAAIVALESALQSQ
jgi:hypothetical protein